MQNRQLTTDNDKSHLWPAAILTALALLWFKPIARVGGGWWQSHTFWHEPLRALGVVEAWRCGLWDARWFPDFDYGYGYPFLSYYAPLFHWLSGLWTALLGSPTVAVRVNLLAWLLLGTAGMYFAGERIWSLLAGSKATSVRPGLICAVGWLMSPYLMCQVFVRGALAEFASCQTLPWVVWGAFTVLGREQPWSREDWRDLLLAAILVVVGILSHNFIGMCVWATAAALVPIVVLVRQVGQVRQVGHVGQVQQVNRGSACLRIGLWAAALVWALATTAFYWLPALHERGFVRVNALKEQSYEYWNHYLVWSNFSKIFYWDFGVSLRGPGDEMPLHLGFVSIVALAGVLIATVMLATSQNGRPTGISHRRRSKPCAALSGLGDDVCDTVPGALPQAISSRPFRASNELLFDPRTNGQKPGLRAQALGIFLLVLLTAIGIALTTRISAPLWDRMALLQYAQFPWRLLCLPTVGICLLLPAPIVATRRDHRRLVTAMALIALAVCFAASHYFYGRIKGEEPPAPELDPATWRQVRILTADLDEYGPIWRPPDRRPTWPPGSLLADGPVEVKSVINRHTTIEAAIVNRSTQPQPLIVALNYFPAWQARTEPDNKHLIVSPEPATGFVLVENVPSGSSHVRLWFGNTAARRNGKIVSGAAWLLWFALAAIYYIRPAATAVRSSLANKIPLH